MVIDLTGKVGYTYLNTKLMSEDFQTNQAKEINLLDKINRLANTDLVSGEVRPAFNKFPTIDVYKNSGISEKMGSPERGFGKELLDNNKRLFLDRIKKLAEEKGTYTKENIRRKEAIKLVLYNLPVFHYTNQKSLAGNSQNDSDGYANLEKYGLISGKKAKEMKGSAINTNQKDEKLNRDEYAYASLGYLYMIGNKILDTDTRAIVLDSKILKAPNTIIQDEFLQNQIGLGEISSKSEEIYKDLTLSSMLASDYIEVLATGIATDVIDPVNTFAEVMVKDNIPYSDIKYILEPLSDLPLKPAETKSNYNDLTKELDRNGNGKKINKTNIFYRKISAPADLFFRLNDKSVLLGDFSLTKGNNPWYKKVMDNFLQEKSTQ